MSDPVIRPDPLITCAVCGHPEQYHLSGVLPSTAPGCMWLPNNHVGAGCKCRGFVRKEQSK